MFKLVALVALVALAAAVAAVAAATASAHEIQVKGEDTGSFSLELIGPNLFRSTDVSSGVASHLGPYGFLAHEIYDASQNVVTSAEFTITTRHGTLFGSYTATLGVGSTPNIGTYHAPGSVTGGTGRYADASGTITFDGYGDFDTHALVDHFTASINLPKDDQASRALAASDASGTAGAASSSQVVVKAAYNKTLGTSILVDRAGRTLYMFTEDTNGKDTACTPQGPWGAECPAIWPALTSVGTPRAGSGVKASLLSVYTRRDGKRQVTYNRHPLYYFHGDPNTPPGDKKAGDTRGQGFADEWYVLSPKGTPIRK